MGFGDEYLVLAGVGFLFNFLGAVALLAAAGAALYCAVQMKRVLAELQEQTKALRRLAGEQAEEEEAAE